MLQKTKGIVLRSVKYGETSLVTTIFTAEYGVETYMVKGVRTAASRRNKAGFFQPATLLDLVVYQQPQKAMQHIREFQAAHIFGNMQEDVVKNSIVLFSIEVMLRLLPPNAPLPSLFDFAFQYFVSLDKIPHKDVANLPLYFIIQCSRILGYELKGNFTTDTPHLNLQEGGFTHDIPAAQTEFSDNDARLLDQMLVIDNHEELSKLDMSSGSRLRLIDWYIAFLQLHTQHMGNVRSLSVLRTILH
jgi:DNA repair protein RecO (recombination protein O)